MPCTTFTWKTPADTADETSEARYQTVENALKASQGTLDVDKAKQIIATHQDGLGALCRHRPRDGVGTISAAIFLPAKFKLLMCDGLPCEGTYVTYAL